MMENMDKRMIDFIEHLYSFVPGRYKGQGNRGDGRTGSTAALYAGRKQSQGNQWRNNQKQP
jgi:hypothetical protein